MCICKSIKKAVIHLFDDLPETDYVLFLIPTLAEIICEDVTDRIRELHFSAYRQLQAHLNFYKGRGYCEKERTTDSQNHIKGGNGKAYETTRTPL